MSTSIAQPKDERKQNTCECDIDIVVVAFGIMDILSGHEVLVGTYEEYVLGYAPKEDKSGNSLQLLCVQDFRFR